LFSVVCRSLTFATGCDESDCHDFGIAEREAAEAMIGELSGRHRITLGAAKAYATANFGAGMCQQNVTPPVTRRVLQASGHAQLGLSGSIAGACVPLGVDLPRQRLIFISKFVQCSDGAHR
jgi:hypothetical protein